ncbi:MAG: arylsulfatase [Anaerolineae bacterium]|nr:arylsulfatase [Anaerolineae bacterium]
MTTSRPNVILVITDDQGYGDLGCHGNPVAQTPHMDALYAESVRLTDFHAAPMCTPTRGQLLTGLDAARNGAVNVSSGRTLLRADLQTMADVFRAGGYRTGVFGKWHLGDNYPFRPEDRGFDESLWFPSSHISSLPDYWENDYFDDVYHRNGELVRYEGYCTEVFFREAMAWMAARAAQGEPFLAYLPTNAPHAPWFVPAADREAIEQAFAAHEDALPAMDAPHRANLIRFLAMIRNLDGHLGRLRDFLQAQDIAGNTMLIYMTDNGSTFGPTYYNAGMRGAKCSLWEGGHRVPCFIHWPDGGLGEPRDIDGLTEVQDILPTLIDLCGLDAPEGVNFDGISLAPVLRREARVPEDRVLAVNYSRMPRFDYPSPDSEAVMRREGAAVLWKHWRLLESVALYDLRSDPAQEHNVIDQYPEVASAMEAALDAWWAGVEPVANQVQRIIIGSDAENPMMLSACEWRDVFVDQQHQVRVGVRKNSYWHLDVAQAGTYRFELRRWPRESGPDGDGLRLTEACPAAELTDGYLEEGVALPIAQARMMIARQWHTQPVAPEDKAAVFTVRLEAGPTLLHTWFDDDRNQPLCGAYYVYVTRL